MPLLHRYNLLHAMCISLVLLCPEAPAGTSVSDDRCPGTEVRNAYHISIAPWRYTCQLSACTIVYSCSCSHAMQIGRCVVLHTARLLSEACVLSIVAKCIGFADASSACYGNTINRVHRAATSASSARSWIHCGACHVSVQLCRK